MGEVDPAVPSPGARPAASPRLVAMSRTGRFVIIRHKSGVAIVDALGASRRVSIELEGAGDFACVGTALWLIAGGVLHRYALSSGDEHEHVAELPEDATRVVPSEGSDHSALVFGSGGCSLVQSFGEKLKVLDVSADLEPGAFAAPLAGRRLLLAREREIVIRDAGRGDVAAARLPGEGVVVAGSSLFGGRAIAVLTRADQADAFVVVRPNGSVIHNVPLPATDLCAIAGTRGLAIVHAPDERKLLSVDLRYGKILGEADAPIDVANLAVDSDGKHVLLAGFRDEGDEDDDSPLAVLHVPYTDIFGGGGKLGKGRVPIRNAEVEQVAPVDPWTVLGFRDDGDDGDHDGGEHEALPPLPDEAERRRGDDDAPRADEGPVTIPDVPLLALGNLPKPIAAEAPPGVAPYPSAQAHLDDLLDLVSARTARAIARAWDTGRLSLPAEDLRPFEREVKALVGAELALAPDAVAEADERMRVLTARAGQRALATIAAGMGLPFVEIAREFQLTTTAAQVLLVAAAPALRGEIARLYGVLANDENRPICDRYLVELVLGGDDASGRQSIARELAFDAPLIEHGLVRLGAVPADQYLFAPLSVDRVLLSRLRGDRYAGAGPGEVTNIRWANRGLDELIVPDAVKRDLIVALARPPRDGSYVRVVVSGRLGSGRRSLLAALAARAGRPLAVIDAERLPRRGPAFVDALRGELRRAGLRGAVPCVSGLDFFDSEDAEAAEHLRAVFRSHAGPITFRASPESRPPLDPGYITAELPSLTEAQRLEFWRTTLSRRGIEAEDAEQLASRFRIGPGTIERILDLATTRAELEGSDGDLSGLIDEVARQHIDTRMGTIATQITRLARWEQVALPADVLDSIREFVGRVRQRRTVYDTWGFDAKMSTSRGLSALFYGPPGTGKSMVAGLIARELGLDLYRVDLARVTSKWIGETEKNLAAIFDAAEDGQCVILFDEADSLFAKRTEVKSSVDRYANLEVNYLLQRFDTFEGIAILTTNLEGSLDNAFKRRLSLRLAFPFPDEEMRVRLWAAHIPAEVPTAGDFDFKELAHKYPLSGGYIRNSALRAAFLAAQEGVPMSHEHLVRAIQLEYRELGKLAPGGRME